VPHSLICKPRRRHVVTAFVIDVLSRRLVHLVADHAFVLNRLEVMTLAQRIPNPMVVPTTLLVVVLGLLIEKRFSGVEKVSGSCLAFTTQMTNRPYSPGCH
jgi:hypothetical protein